MQMLKANESAAIRAQFPVFREKIYLGTCSQGALCDVVAASLQEHIACWNKHGLPWDYWIEKYEAMRRGFAAFIGAKPEEVALTSSVSAGINAIASAMDYSDRNKVVMGEFEFPTMGHAWLAQERRGAQVEFLRPAGGRIPLEAYERAIDRKTRIVPVTSVCFMNGSRSQICQIREIVHQNGAFVMVDDYQDAGTRPINVKQLGVDFYVTGALKYLLGSSGLAFLYVREELIEKLVPTQSSWIAQADAFAYRLHPLDWATSARRFEVGTPPIQNIYALLPVVSLLQQTGLDRIATHVAELTRAFMEAASVLEIEIKTPADSVGPLVVLKCKDIPAILAKLEEQHITASSRFDGLRIAFHLYNNMDDVRAVLQVLEANLELMARSTAMGNHRRIASSCR